MGLASLLDAGGQTLIVEALTRRGSPIVNQIVSKPELDAFKAYLQKLTGMDDAWIKFVMRDVEQASKAEVLDAFGAWLLCVEYVHDLRREPYFEALKRLKSLSTPLVKSCSSMVCQLRKNYPDDYVEIADNVEVMISPELIKMEPEDLGQIDTFSEEENRCCGALSNVSRHKTGPRDVVGNYLLDKPRTVEWVGWDAAHR